MELKIIVPIFIIATMFVSGCTGIGGATTLDMSSIASQIPEVREFLKENPNAEITVVLWTSEYIQNNIDKIQEECLPSIETGKPYYRAEVNEEGEIIVAWLTSDAKEAVCIVRRVSESELQEEIQEEAPVEEETSPEPEEEEEETPEEEAEPEEEEPQEEETTDPVLVLDQQCEEGLLFLTIQNNREEDVSTSKMKTLLAIEDETGEDVCSKKPLAMSTCFKCNSGCDETIAQGENESIVILISKCEDLLPFRDYSYELIFNDVSVTGDFRYKE